MKFIHCADLHLGSKLNSVFDKDDAKAKIRRVEILNSFETLVSFARENDVRLILLSGDVFDSDRPIKADKEYFYHTVAENKDIDFLYLRGNHDAKGAYAQSELPENLYMFGDTWTTYEKGNLAVHAVELTDDNYLNIYSAFNADPSKINVVMLHGQIKSSPDRNSVCLELLRNKNIDYLALGHIHSFDSGRLDKRGVYAYSGCLEGRGFDESGDKGFVLLNLEGGSLSYSFIKAAKRTLHEVTVNVDDCENAVQAEAAIDKALIYPSDDIISLTITGEMRFDGTSFEDKISERLNRKFFYVKLKNKTDVPVDFSLLKTEVSKRGEFVRAVLNRNDLDEDRKKQIIRVGLTVLNGESDKL